MQKANFYPGPSRVSSSIAEYFYDACREGIVSINHRSAEFAELMKLLRQQMHTSLDIPLDYEIVFASSATECWEIIAQSVIDQSSVHFHNGAFGEKWLQYTEKLVPSSTGLSFALNEAPNVANQISEQSSCICFTQNETSNGTQVPMETIRAFRAKYPEKIIAVDATSSMAGIKLDFTLADVWFASVQKCFGMPAGLAVMVLSPKAVARAEKLQDRKHYNSLLFMLDNYRSNQAPYTPNITYMYLLYRMLKKCKSIEEIESKLRDRRKSWYKTIAQIGELKPLVHNAEVRSQTVLALQATPEVIRGLKLEAANAGIIFGNGYGQWKADTIRIANFPAIKSREIEIGQQFLLKKFT